MKNILKRFAMLFALVGVLATTTVGAYASSTITYRNDTIVDENLKFRTSWTACDKNAKGATLAYAIKEDAGIVDATLEDWKAGNATYTIHPENRYKVGLDSQALNNAKAMGDLLGLPQAGKGQLWDEVVIPKDASAKKSLDLPLFNSDGVAYNYISATTAKVQHTRGGVLTGLDYDVEIVAGGGVDGKVGHHDVSENDFGEYWSTIAKDAGLTDLGDSIASEDWEYSNYYMAGKDGDFVYTTDDQGVRYFKTKLFPVYFSTTTGTVNLSGRLGIFILPYADVVVPSCNWCGTIVAKSIESLGESHLWTWGNGQKDDNDYEYWCTDVTFEKPTYKEVNYYGKKVVTPDRPCPKTGENNMLPVFAVTLALLVLIVSCALCLKKFNNENK